MSRNDTSPLRSGLAARMVLVLAVAVAALSAVVWVVVDRANQAATQRRLADVTAFVAKRLVEVDHGWNTQADVLRAQIDFARVLDEPDDAARAARLGAFFAVLGGESLFTHALLLVDGRIAFRYGTQSQASLALPEGKGRSGWVFSPADATVYRSIVQPVLVAGRPAQLALFVPVDRALLRANSLPGVTLALRWQGQAVGVSDAPAGPAGAEVEIAWAGDAAGPRVGVRTSAAEPVGVPGAMGVALLGGLAVALLGWAVLGRWLSRLADRLLALQRATALFSTQQRVTPEVEQALAAADRSGTREIEALRAQTAETMRASEQAQSSLAQLNTHLEERVADRTRALEASRDEALAGTRAKEQFLATISHELRTPLVGLIGSLDLLHAAEHGAGQRELLGIARTSGEGLLVLINELLDFAKIEAGKLQLAHEPFDPVALVDEVVRLFSATARAKGLQLHPRADGLDADLRVAGDRSRLRQVLLNLVSNAIKFTASGEVAVQLRQEPATPGRARLTFAVQDAGQGVADADRERIFQPFEQARRRTGGTEGGTGLGLAISQRLIDAMGGRIELASAPGLGARFHFTVDLALAQSPAGATPPEGASSAGQPPLAGHVLVVDDNLVNRVVANEMLAHLGLAVTEAEDGLAAFERIQDERFDAVLMDCLMPVMDGFAATRLLREREARLGLPRLPVIALTANVMSTDLARCTEAGMDLHVAKPFTLAQLRSALAAVLPAVPREAPQGAASVPGPAR